MSKRKCYDCSKDGWLDHKGGGKYICPECGSKVSITSIRTDINESNISELLCSVDLSGGAWYATCPGTGERLDGGLD